MHASQSYRRNKWWNVAEPGSLDSRPSVLASVPSLLAGCGRGREYQKGKWKLWKTEQRATHSGFWLTALAESTLFPDSCWVVSYSVTFSWWCPKIIFCLPMTAWLQNTLHRMVLPHYLIWAFQQPCEKDKKIEAILKNKISIQGPTVKRIAGTKTVPLSVFGFIFTLHTLGSWKSFFSTQNPPEPQMECYCQLNIYTWCLSAASERMMKTQVLRSLFILSPNLPLALSSLLPQSER